MNRAYLPPTYRYSFGTSPKAGPESPTICCRKMYLLILTSNLKQNLFPDNAAAGLSWQVTICTITASRPQSNLPPACLPSPPPIYPRMATVVAWHGMAVALRPRIFYFCLFFFSPIVYFFFPPCIHVVFFFLSGRGGKQSRESRLAVEVDGRRSVEPQRGREIDECFLSHAKYHRWPAEKESSGDGAIHSTRLNLRAHLQ